MLQVELMRDKAVLVLSPHGRLEAGDFEAVAAQVDPFIAEHGHLAGLMIKAQAFPGWKDFAGLLAHLRFVKAHHRLVARVATVSDSTLLEIMPVLAGHFAAAQFKHFAFEQADQALAWLEAKA